MVLKHQVIKISHEQLDEPLWDGTYGWIPKGDHADEMLQSIMYENDIEDRDGFEVKFYKIEGDEMMEILDDKEPYSTHEY